MRIFKLAAISVLTLFFIVTVIGLLFPSVVRVSRAIDINAPKDSVHHLIADVKYWKLWMEGAQENTIQFLSAKTAGAGTVAKMGNNEVSIKKATASTIETIWKTESGNSQTAMFNLISTNNTTTVQWYFEQHLRWYPWERFGSMMNDKVLGPTMEISLNNLKNVAEGEDRGREL